MNVDCMDSDVRECGRKTPSSVLSHNFILLHCSWKIVANLNSCLEPARETGELNVLLFMIYPLFYMWESYYNVAGGNFIGNFVFFLCKMYYQDRACAWAIRRRSNTGATRKITLQRDNQNHSH